MRDLIDTADPFLAAVVTSGQAVVGVAHLRRRPSAAQQTALEWLYPSCAVEGCTATTWLENDHRLEWAETHMTVWALVDGRGKRAFVAPDDPDIRAGCTIRPARRDGGPRAVPPAMDRSRAIARSGSGNPADCESTFSVP